MITARAGQKRFFNGFLIIWSDMRITLYPSAISFED